jgi:hypothetical protein
MMTSQAAKAAEQAAEAIRTINHATISTDSFEPSDIYDIVAELAVLTHRLPQAFGQLARIVEHLNRDGRVGFDTGSLFAGSAANGVMELRAALDRASDHAEQVRHALDDAQRILSAARRVDPVTTVR